MTGFSGHSGRWWGKIESSIPSKVHKEPAGRHGLQGKNHLQRKQWPRSQVLTLEIDSLFFVFSSCSSVPELSVLLLMPLVAAAQKDGGKSAQTDAH